MFIYLFYQKDEYLGKIKHKVQSVFVVSVLVMCAILIVFCISISENYEFFLFAWIIL